MNTDRQNAAIASLPALIANVRAARTAFQDATEAQTDNVPTIHAALTAARDALTLAIDRAVASVKTGTETRRAEVNGRFFFFFSCKRRIGDRGARRTVTVWTFAEVNAAGDVLENVTAFESSLSSAHRTVAKRLGLV